MSRTVFITARKRSLGQGNIFTPVCHSVHRGGMCGCGGEAGGGRAWLLGGAMCGCSGGMRGCLGGHAWLLLGGVHGCSRGHAWLLGGHAWLLPGGHAWLLWGACMVAPRGACMVALGGGGSCVGYDEIRRYGQWAGGTHPTGMHSCCYLKCHLLQSFCVG